jgi:hypothetical protein
VYSQERASTYLETELARAKSGKFGVGFITCALKCAPKMFLITC